MLINSVVSLYIKYGMRLAWWFLAVLLVVIAVAWVVWFDSLWLDCLLLAVVLAWFDCFLLLVTVLVMLC